MIDNLNKVLEADELLRAAIFNAEVPLGPTPNDEEMTAWDGAQLALMERVECLEQEIYNGRRELVTVIRQAERHAVAILRAEQDIVDCKKALSTLGVDEE